MQKFKLKNKLKVIYDPKQTDSVAIQINVKTGSNNETKDVAGISHFIEHMLFEGTKKRPNSKTVANEIESLGGELNAYTSNERTAYYTKILKKHFDIALDVLSDIIQNPLFKQKDIERERKIILEEVKLVTDEPRIHQWVLFYKTLFHKHPVKNPTYGTVEAIKKISRQDLLGYYYRYYVPSNITVSVVGDVKNIRSKLAKAFTFERESTIEQLKIIEPSQLTRKTIKEKRKIQNTYLVLGYKTAKRTHADSYVLDIIKAILGRGQSGKMFYEIRTKHGLAYEVGIHHDPATDYGAFAVYLSTNKKNTKKATKLILKVFSELKNLSPKELKEAKNFLEGSYRLENENTYERADTLNYWEQMGSLSLADKFIANTKKVSLSDVKRAAKKYFTKNYVLAVIEQLT